MASRVRLVQSVAEAVPADAGCSGRRQKCFETSSEASGIGGLPSFTFCSPHAKEQRAFSRGCGVWERRETIRVLTALSGFPVSTFLDLGARSGWFAALAAAAGHPTLAVEPNLNSSCIAQQNFARNGLSDRVKLFVHGADITVHEMRLTGTHATNLESAISWTPARSLLSNIDSSLTARYMHTAGERRTVEAEMRTFTERTQTVTTIRLDSLAPFVPTRELVLKVDIDGYECEALTGAAELLTRFPPRMVIMEWGSALAHAAERRGCVWRHALAPFEQAGLRAFDTKTDAPFNPAAHVAPAGSGSPYATPTPIYWAAAAMPVIRGSKDALRSNCRSVPKVVDVM